MCIYTARRYVSLPIIYVNVLQRNGEMLSMPRNVRRFDHSHRMVCKLCLTNKFVLLLKPASIHRHARSAAFLALFISTYQTHDWPMHGAMTKYGNTRPSTIRTLVHLPTRVYIKDRDIGTLIFSHKNSRSCEFGLKLKNSDIAIVRCVSCSSHEPTPHHS
ncbi:hypothetical protein BDR06DRAFT_147836 [Suillus hirtellus]|nr:hypothetical protein BDR06DRAFT_147836 [Suillus hirtellus]